MTHLNNLKEGVIQKVFSDDTIQKQEENDKNNYDIKMKRNELKDLIFALNIVISDIKNNQNKIYITNEIENIITKLQKADIPPKKEFTTVPTFSTVDLKELNNSNDNKSYTPLIPGLSNNLIDNKTYCTEFTSNEKEKYEGPIINGKKEGKGIYIYQNGCKYEGYFKNDKKEGNGILFKNQIIIKRLIQ